MGTGDKSMSRITNAERLRFHEILDDVIDMKMNSKKNKNKPHWQTESLIELGKMQIIEAHELDLAVLRYETEEIISECHDNITIPLFIIDNINGNQ